MLTASLYDASGHETNTSGSDPSTTSTVTTTSEQGIHRVIDIDRFGSYQELLRVTAYVMRFIQNSKSSKRRPEPLLPNELLQAEKTWLIDCQSSSYPAEISNMRLSKSSSQLVKQLRLFFYITMAESIAEVEFTMPHWSRVQNSLTCYHQNIS